MEIWDWSTSQKGVKGLARGGADMLICCWGGTGASSVDSITSLLAEAGEREGRWGEGGGREGGGREGGGSEGGKEGEREGEKDGEREGEREGGMEGGRDGGREGRREHEFYFLC